MPVHELGHVVLYVRDIGASRRFYGDVLGWRELPGAPDPRLAAFSSGRTHHELLLIEAGARAQPVPRGPRLGMYHFGVKVGTTDGELAAMAARLREAGAPIVGTADHAVTHSLYVLDPDGNEVELYVDVQPEAWRERPELMFSPPRALRLSPGP